MMEDVAKVMWEMLIYGMISISLFYAFKLIFNMQAKTSDNRWGILIRAVFSIIMLWIIGMWIYFTILTINIINNEQKRNNSRHNTNISSRDTTNTKTM